MRLVGKKTIITGGGRGIGRAYVERFLAEGAHVLIGDIDVVNAEKTVEELKDHGEISFLRVDVSDEESVQHFVEAAAAQLGGIDVLLNNAALLADWDSSDESLTNLKRVFDVNLHSLWLMTRAAAPYLIKSGAGRVINQASTAAYNHHWNGPTDEFGGLSSFSYSQSKYGVIGLTKFTAGQLGKFGVTVNAITPGMTFTPAIGNVDPAAMDKLLAEQAIVGRIQPEDLTGIAVYYASDESHFVTGQNMLVDGGRFMPA
ncbi:MAG: hypothetical protein JWO98_2187 [Frankiales bacterium]|nr:hypothetical protein [Frankiales bacterium]